MDKPSALADWTPEQIALGKKWVETWKLAAVDLERIKRKEIRELDTYKTISLLCHDRRLHQAALCTKAMVWTNRTTAIVQKGGGS